MWIACRTYLLRICLSSCFALICLHFFRLRQSCEFILHMDKTVILTFSLLFREFAATKIPSFSIRAPSSSHTRSNPSSPHPGRPLHSQQVKVGGQRAMVQAVKHWTVASSSHHYSYLGSWRRSACGSLARILKKAKKQIALVTEIMERWHHGKKRSEETSRFANQPQDGPADKQAQHENLWAGMFHWWINLLSLNFIRCQRRTQEHISSMIQQCEKM